MSRAFVKEPDGDEVVIELPERAISPHPNYVTPRGKSLLENARAARLAERDALADSDELGTRQRRAEIDRDLRYLDARLASAKVVLPDREAEEVLVGARVTTMDDDGKQVTYTVVGEDEADASSNLISWVSPIGQALLGARVGDEVIWQRPIGEMKLEIIDVDYEPEFERLADLDCEGRD